MARPPTKDPTEAEFEVLTVLWQRGPSTLREIRDGLPGDLTRAAVHTRLQTMLDKELLTLRPRPKGEGGTVYHPATSRAGVVGQMFRRLTHLFGGTPRALVQGLLREGQLDEAELKELRDMLRDQQHKNGDGGAGSGGVDRP
jgi:BlaI family transcriptional regulator, penicillinase repressor